MFLSNSELINLTKRVKFNAQRKVLNQMGVTHLVRPDRSIVVARAHVRKLLGMSDQNVSLGKQGPGPNWEEI